MANNAKKIRKGFYNPKCPDLQKCPENRGKYNICSSCQAGIWIFIPHDKAVVIVDENQVFGYRLRGQRKFNDAEEEVQVIDQFEESEENE